MKPARLTAIVVIPVILFVAWYLYNDSNAEKSGLSTAQLSQMSQRVGQQIGALQNEIAELQQSFRDNHQQKIDKQTLKDNASIQLAGNATNSEIEKLEIKITQLNDRIFALENNHDSVSYDDSQNTVNLTTKEDQTQMVSEQTEARFESFQSNLLHEDIDYKWSNTAMSSIENALQNQEIAHSAIQTMECRTTLCEVQVTHDSHDDLDKFELWFPTYVNQELPRVAMKHQKNANGDFTTTVYLARKGHSFPKIEQ